jgi:uncharacterized protein YodC (DUF2158 family)
MEMPIAKGDVVHERMGGPVMRVTGVDGARVRCIMSTKSGWKYREFKSSELEKVVPVRRRPITFRFS